MRWVWMLGIGAMAVAGRLPAAEAPRVPDGFRPVTGTVAEPYTRTGWAREIVHVASGMELVFIPAGDFLMGSPESEEGRDNGNVYGAYTLTGRNDEGPQQRVRIERPFYMGRHEVTQEEWARVLTNPPAVFTGDKRLPVDSAPAEACAVFLGALNAAGAGNGRFRLPTESEWEYACRAGTTTPFAFGATLTPAQANFNGESGYGGGGRGEYRRTTTPVGNFAPNAWGLCDMHGNVWERCGNAYALYPTNGPLVEVQGTDALRGGAWYCRPGLCRSANRYQEPGFHRGAGLRVVWTPRD